MSNPHDAKFILMTTTPVGSLVCSLAVPTIASMMVTALYNLADTYFVGMLENNSATGVVLAFMAGILITVLGQIFCEPLAKLLGSTPTILPYAKD